MYSAIVLASGLSRRMGFDKLSHPWGDTTILETTLSQVCKADFDEVLVVLQPESQLLQVGHLPDKVRKVFNPAYLEGMASTIRKGVASLDSSSQWVTICLGDMPLIQASTYQLIIDFAASERGKSILIPTCQSQWGNPISFYHSKYELLLQLQGDKGAKQILHSMLHDIAYISTDDKGILLDMDTPSDI